MHFSEAFGSLDVLRREHHEWQRLHEEFACDSDGTEQH